MKNDEKVIILLIITILIIRIFNPSNYNNPGSGPGTGLEFDIILPNAFINETLKSYIFENVTYINNIILYNNKTCTLTYNNTYDNIQTLIPQYGSHTSEYQNILVYLETPRCDIKLYHNDTSWWGEYYGNQYPPNYLIISSNITDKFVYFVNLTYKYLSFSPNLYDVSNYTFIRHETVAHCTSSETNYKYYLYPNSNIFVVTCLEECNPKLIC